MWCVARVTCLVIIINNFQQCIQTGILIQNISTGIGLFWDDFPINFFPRETWTDPPTYSDFLFMYERSSDDYNPMNEL